MVAINWFAKLPASVAQNLLSEWLTAKSMSKLDVAMCNRAQIKVFLELLRGLEIRTANHILLDQNMPYKLLWMQWMVNRAVKYSILKVGCSMPSRKSLAPFSAANLAIADAYIHRGQQTLKDVWIYSNDRTAEKLLQIIATHQCALSSLLVNTFPPGNTRAPQWNDALGTVLLCSANTLVELSIDYTINWTTYCDRGLRLPALCKLTATTISDEYIASMCTVAPNLRTLDLHKPRCSSEGLAAIGNCRELETLSIYGYRVSTVPDIDVGIAALAAGCSQLRHIKLSQLPNLTGDCLAAVATHCTQLQELHLLDNQYITDQYLTAFALALSNTGTCTNSLTSLLVRCCPLVTGSGIVAIAKFYPILHSLDISNMYGITTDNLTLHMIIPHLHTVVSLNLYSVAVDDVALELIAEHMPLVVELNIANYPDNHGIMHSTYTSMGLRQIADKCEKLQVLNLGGKILSLSREEVARWKFMRPGLTITPTL